MVLVVYYQYNEKEGGVGKGPVLALTLAAYFSKVSWLAKDIIFLFTAGTYS